GGGLSRGLQIAPETPARPPEQSHVPPAAGWQRPVCELERGRQISSLAQSASFSHGVRAQPCSSNWMPPQFTSSQNASRLQVVAGASAQRAKSSSGGSGSGSGFGSPARQRPSTQR